MTVSAFVLLLAISLLIIIVSLVGIRSRRKEKRSARSSPTAAGGQADRGAAAAVPVRSMVWTSPVWNVIGVGAGIVGTIISAVALFK
jgi:hypothetical protein